MACFVNAFVWASLPELQRFDDPICQNGYSSGNDNSPGISRAVNRIYSSVRLVYSCLFHHEHFLGFLIAIHFQTIEEQT